MMFTIFTRALPWALNGRGDNFQLDMRPSFSSMGLIEVKGPVKLIKRVKIAHSFLQSVSNQFHVIILSLPM